MKISTLMIAEKIGQISSEIRSMGLTIHEVTDFEEFSSLIYDLGKDYVTPFNSPQHNDFTEKNALWLVAKKEGYAVAGGLARLEDIGSESIASYWKRTFARHYGHGAIGGFRPGIHQIGGRLVYFGDLFVSPRIRGSRAFLRAFISIGHLLVTLKWSPDWTYCFVRERDVLRGAATIYGFSRIFGPPFDWNISPPKPRCRSEFLVGVPRSDISIILEQEPNEQKLHQGSTSLRKHIKST